jgi:hypothetical protein
MHFKRWQKITSAVVAIPVLIVGGYIVRHTGIGIDRSDLPKFIQHDFIDLDKVTSVSKFRSGEGHDFSGGGETCRSMKHYFSPNYSSSDPKGRVYEGKELPPLPDGKTDTAIYSPVDGTIQGVSEEHTPIGKQVNIVPDDQPRFVIRLFHVFLNDGITGGLAGLGGTHVTAGQQIGVISKYQGTDISVQIGALPWEENFVSYFDVMPDSVFAAYQKRGVASRSDFIFTKEYRDAHPLECNDTSGSQQFTYPDGYDKSLDDVHLSGYTVPDYTQNLPGNNQQNQQQGSGKKK